MNQRVIKSPRIGFLNLLRSAGQSILEEDKTSIGSLFSALVESDTDPPLCDVLMLYARVKNDGRMLGSQAGLREIIHKSSASIVIIASENETKNYIAAGKPTRYGQTNLVMTLRRNGPAFPQFFSQLFRSMYQGKSMPVAWVELSPQGSKLVQGPCPESIFSAELGHIVFG